MISRQQFLAVSANVSGVCRAIVDVSRDILFRLAMGERKRLCPSFAHNLIEIVAEFLECGDVAERIGNVRVTRGEALALRIIRRSGAFRLDRGQAETGNEDVFLICLVGIIQLVQVGIFDLMFAVLTPKPGFYTRPECFRMITSGDWSCHWLSLLQTDCTRRFGVEANSDLDLIVNQVRLVVDPIHQAHDGKLI